MKSADGLVELIVPPGALSSETSLTIATSATSTPLGLVGTVYEIGPSGTVFDVPATLRWRAPDSLLADPAAPLVLATSPEPGTWVALDSVSPDAAGGVLLGAVEHLTPFALFNVAQFAMTPPGTSTIPDGSTGAGTGEPCPPVAFPLGSLETVEAPADFLTSYAAKTDGSCYQPVRCFIDLATTPLNTQLSQHFTLGMLAGQELVYSHYALVAPELVAALETLWATLGPLTITSGFRSAGHQVATCQMICGGGASSCDKCAATSRHSWGDAADIDAEYPACMQAAAAGAFPYCLPENGHLHVDLRPPACGGTCPQPEASAQRLITKKSDICAPLLCCKGPRACTPSSECQISSTTQTCYDSTVLYDYCQMDSLPDHQVECWPKPPIPSGCMPSSVYDALGLLCCNRSFGPMQ